jgi:hypothetical protein
MNTAAAPKNVSKAIDQWLDIHFGDTSFNGRVFVGKKDIASGKLLTAGIRPLNAIRSYVKQLPTETEQDYYITANTVCGVRRRKNELFGLQNIVIDIDSHDGSQPQHVSALVEAFIWRCKRDLWDEGVIPTPNTIVRTGRGMQLWWALVPCYGGRGYDVSLYYFKKIKRNIIGHIAALLDEHSEELGDFELCPTANNNLVGYYRLPGSYNSSAGRYSSFEILHSRRHDQRELAKIETPDFVTKPEVARGKKEYIPFQESDRRLLNGLGYIGARRVMQLVNLRNLRNNGVGEERRNDFNFSVYNALRMTLDHDDAMARLRDFNAGFKQPMTEKELEISLCAAKDRGGYKYSNETLIELLKITPEEQRAIGLFLCTKKRRSKPNASRDELRAALREDRDQKILKLLEEGKSQAETARILGIGKNTVGRFVKKQREAEAEAKKNACEPAAVTPITQNSTRHHFGSLFEKNTAFPAKKKVSGGGVLVLPVYDSDSS